MKIYVVQNSEGKFFRPRGYGGGGKQWQDTLEKAKFYTKLGTAKTQCTTWFNINPKFGCPHVLEFNLDQANAVKIDMLEQATVSAKKKAEKEAQRQAEYKLYHQLQDMSKVKEIMKTLTPEQRRALGFSA